MKTSYTYTVLQYVHDAVSGEGVNVGVVVYAKSLPYVKAKMSMRYGRVSEFFGGIDGDALLSSLRATESGILEAKNKLSDTLPFIERPPSVRAITDAIIPPDDSALRFSEARPGVTEDLDEALEQLFARYVLRYDKSLRRRAALTRKSRLWCDRKSWAAIYSPRSDLEQFAVKTMSMNSRLPGRTVDLEYR